MSSRCNRCARYFLSTTAIKCRAKRCHHRRALKMGTDVKNVRYLIAALATSLFSASATAHSGAHEAEPLPLRFDRAIDGWPVPDFSLVDQNGDELDRHRLLGQWSFVLF